MSGTQENTGKSKALLEAEEALTAQQISELKEAFQLFDRDGDGTISTDELGIVLRSIGQNPTDAQIEAMIAEVDDDKNGYCEYDEFLLLMSKKMNDSQMDEEMMEAFKTFDDKGKGYISYNDLKRVLKSYNENLSDEEVKLMFKETDADKDDKINFKDFILMMMAK